MAELVRAALGLLETEGTEALTMRHLAELVGMRAPSIYKHFDSKAALEVALVEDALFDMGDALHHSVADPGPDGPVASLLAAYRSEATSHPNRYRLTTSSAFPRADLLAGLEDWAGEPFFIVTGQAYLSQALGVRPRHHDSRARRSLPGGLRSRPHMAGGGHRLQRARRSARSTASVGAAGRAVTVRLAADPPRAAVPPAPGRGEPPVSRHRACPMYVARVRGVIGDAAESDDRRNHRVRSGRRRRSVTIASVVRSDGHHGRRSSA